MTPNVGCTYFTSREELPGTQEFATQEFVYPNDSRDAKTEDNTERAIHAWEGVIEISSGKTIDVISDEGCALRGRWRMHHASNGR